MGFKSCFLSLATVFTAIFSYNPYPIPLLPTEIGTLTGTLLLYICYKEWSGTGVRILAKTHRFGCI